MDYTELVGFLFPGDSLLASSEALRFGRGLNVIYGVNGAGKSRLLSGIESALRGNSSETNVALVVRLDLKHMVEAAEAPAQAELWEQDLQRVLRVEAFGRTPAQAIAAAVAGPGAIRWSMPEFAGSPDEQSPNASTVASVLDELVRDRLGDADDDLVREIYDDGIFLFSPTGTPTSPSWAVWPVADARLPHAAATVEQLSVLADLAYGTDDEDGDFDRVVAYEEATWASPLFARDFNEVWAHGVRSHLIQPYPFMVYDIGVVDATVIRPIHVAGRVDFGIDFVDTSLDIALLTRHHLAALYAALVSTLDEGSSRASRSALEGRLELLSPRRRADALRPRGRRDWFEVVEELRSRGQDHQEDISWWRNNDPADVDSVEATMAELVADLEQRVNRTLRSVLLDAPEAHLDAGPTPSRFVASPVSWTFGRFHFDLAALSRAERQWAERAIREAIQMQLSELVAGGAGERALMILIDEPESALHRAAEAHMASTLRRRAEDGLIVVAATHSPELLDAPEGMVTEVKKHGLGRQSLVQPLDSTQRENLESLGLLPSDLLRRYRTILLVEGEHEEVLLNAFLGDRLRAARVRVLPLHGGKKLPGTVDSQVLFSHTDAHVVALLDNLRVDRLTSVWATATDLAVRGDVQAAIDAVVAGIPDDDRRKGDEAAYMRGWLTRALRAGLSSRATPYALGEPDIIRYLPVERFVPKAESWSALEAMHEHEQATAAPENRPPRDFKAWLGTKYKVKISPASLRQAATGMPTPRDFERLMKTLEAIGDDTR